MTNFSVITSIYHNDTPDFVRVALDSMLVHQTLKPTEVVLVRDGVVPDFANIAYKLCIRYLSIKSLVTFNLLNINNMHNFLNKNLL